MKIPNWNCFFKINSKLLQKHTHNNTKQYIKQNGPRLHFFFFLFFLGVGEGTNNYKK